MQLKLPRFRAFLQAAAVADVPALRLLPPSPMCKPTPLIERPAARARYDGKVIYVQFM